MRCLFVIFISIPGILYLAECKAQNHSNRGTDFWLGYGHNILFTANNPSNTQNQAVYLSADEATSVTISIPGNGWSRTVNLPSNTVDATIILPKTGPDDARILDEGKWNRGIHIQSQKPIVAYAHQYGSQSGGATLLFPQESLGYIYYSVNYTQVSNFANSHSWFYVVACEDNTRIEITPSDSTHGGRLPGETFTIDLAKGEIYNVFGKLSATDPRIGKDLTGSKVVSVAGSDGRCHPISFFSGSSRVIFCQGDGGEFMQQQVFPVSAWGTKYLSYHTITNQTANLATPSLNFYRVVVMDTATIVRRNGQVLTDLQHSLYYEYSSTAGDIIEADKPVMVCQYQPSSNQCTGNANPPVGDPEMIILSPVEQGITSVRFHNSRLQFIDINYVQLIVPTAGLPTLRINNRLVTSGTIPHPANPAYTVVARRLLGASNQYTITCDSAFTGVVYGLGGYESYAYNLGTKLNNLNGLPALNNRLKSSIQTDTFTCVNAPVEFSLRLAYKATSIQWQLGSLPLKHARDTTLANPQILDSGKVGGRNYYTYLLERDYQFTDTGTFRMKIIATSPDIEYCGNREEMIHEIHVKPGPVADFKLNYSGCLSDSAFLSESSDPLDMVIDRYLWTVNGAPEISDLDFTVKFNSGNNSVRLMVVTTNGCLDDTTKFYSPNIEPYANFWLSKNTICQGDSVFIKDNSGVNGGSALVRWHYSISPGGTTALTDPSSFYLNFADTGTYQISLITETNTNCFSNPFNASLRVFGIPWVDAGPDLSMLGGAAALINATSISPAGTSFSWTPASFLNNPNLLNPSVTPKEDIMYVLRASNGPCMAIDSMTVFVLNDLIIPNAFSPNGDGINDTWVIYGISTMPNVKIRVFDRYGKVIFEKRGYTSPWDGKRNGIPLPIGVYYYIVDPGDGSPIMNGSVTLIR